MGNPPKRRRPWYALLALIGAWLFGAQGLVNGCSYVSYYKEDRTQEISTDDAARVATYHLEPLFHALDDAKNRVFPFAVGMLVLGGAIVMFSARAMGGRKQAREALIQLLCVQAVVCICFFLMTPEVRAAEGDAWRALGYGAGFRRYTPAVLLALRTIATALIVLGLTRRQSFDAGVQGSVSER